MSMTDLPGFEPTRFDTRGAFHAQIRLALDSAQGDICMADANFSRWPLNSIEVEASLRRFFGKSRANRLHLLCTPRNDIARDAPRLMRLLREYSHAFVCRYPSETVQDRFSSDCSVLIVDHTRLVRRFHRDTSRGVSEFDARAVQFWVDQFSALWDEGKPGLSATTLGL